MGKKKQARGGWKARLLVGVSIVVYAMLVFVPNQKAINAARTEIREKTAQTASVESQLKRIRMAESEVAEARAERDAAVAKLPSEQQLSKVHGDLHRRIVQAGAESTRFDPIDGPIYDTLIASQINFQAQGKFDELQAMLARFERMDEPVWIDDIRIGIANGETGELSLQAQLTLFGAKMDKTDARGEGRDFLPVLHKILIRSFVTTCR